MVLSLLLLHLFPDLSYVMVILAMGNFHYGQCLEDREEMWC